ncbi:AI-2E family transporter [Pontibaca salina]|uniref:AI-2E family transporter n=1 Tax=Pontibaca salina TaxID=2795731 RepID=A0A934LYD2_9RHOB|nr:AI-2E family transporter [Pontibaca salina]MBI6629637.1 AI-2E family transporter [Pontibaca salina]
MSLSAGDQLKYWGIAALVFAIVLWFLGHVLLPFVLGMAIAYFLDPLADRLQRWGLSRGAATAVITAGAVLIFILAALLVIPSLVSQTVDLIDLVPVLVNRLQEFLAQHFPNALDEGSPARNALASLGQAIKERGPALFEKLLGSVGSVINVIVLLVIVPVVAVYMLLDWDRMTARIDKLLPRDHAPVVRRLARDIDSSLAGFIRGMGTVCLILGTYYAVALMALGLQFGLVVGFVAGILTFIPYLGAMIGGALAIGLALFQFWGDWGWVAAVTGVFLLGQFAEGNFLTPKLVGNSVGLHPVWLILALSVFGALFGFVGMLVAVPLMAAIGVIARFAIDQYLKSSLYGGVSGSATNLVHGAQERDQP